MGVEIIYPCARFSVSLRDGNLDSLVFINESEITPWARKTTGFVCFRKNKSIGYLHYVYNVCKKKKIEKTIMFGVSASL